MADVTVNATISTASARGINKLVFVTADVGYFFHIDTDSDFVYSKTTDGGATWGTPVQIGPDDSDFAYGVWPDWWTPGDSGTKINLCWFGGAADTVFYRTLDTVGDTLGTQRTVFTGVSAVAGRGNFVSVTKTRSGKFRCAFDMDAGAEKGLYGSDDGITWTLLSETFVEATLDEAMLFPASNTGDDNDCWAVYYDSDATALTKKMWDNSAGNATESATFQTHVESATDLTHRGYGASLRQSDGHIIISAVSERDTPTADHQVFDANGTGSITELTAITTNIDDHHYPSVYIDQGTDDIYVAFNGLRTGAEALGSATKVYYTKSTDGGTTWSAGSTAYMEGAAANVGDISAPLMGPRFYVGWRVTTGLFGNNVNSIALSTDTVAPVLTAQSVTVDPAGMTPLVTTDEATGTDYMVIVPDGNFDALSGADKITRTKAGQRADGTAATAAANQAVTVTGQQTFLPVTTLQPTTAYDCWFVHTDAAGNNSTAVKADFTTDLIRVSSATIFQIGAFARVEEDTTFQLMNLGVPVVPSAELDIAIRRRRRPHWKNQ